jgi:parallel beta-helix repeat protein
VISGSTGDAPFSGFGVILTNNSNNQITHDDQVLGNYIGTDVTGTVALPNNTDGIRVDANSSNITIGGTSIGARNVVSGNKQTGIIVTSGTGNVVQGNYVGTNAAGTAAIPNGSGGVNVGGNGNRVGGTSPGAGNLMSGNQGFGLFLTGTNAAIQGNRIGTNAAGTAALPNSVGGAGIDTGGGAVFGGTDPGAGNLISGNGQYGIRLLGGGGNRVQGNFIGTDITGTLPLGNGNFGVAIEQGVNNLIGGPEVSARNVICANGTGVRLAVFQNTAQGNLIGTDVTGMLPLGNGVGLLVVGSNNTIGGIGTGEGNTIAFNTQAGILTKVPDTGTGNRIRGNSIYSNGGLGIDLGGDGVTLNDPGDADTGPNGRQNFPLLSSAAGGPSTSVTGTVNSTAQTTFAIDFFSSTTADPSGYGEGARYLGSTTVTTDAAGNAVFAVTLATSPYPGGVVTATATDPAGNTSEFSAAVPTITPVVIDVAPGDPTNVVDLNSPGVLGVAVLTTANFDAATLDTTDLARIQFGDATTTSRVSPVRDTLADVNGDGDLDRVLVFSIPDIAQTGALTGTTTHVWLTGLTYTGDVVWGSDAVTTIPYIPPNQPPAVTTNAGLTVARSGSAVLTQAMLQTTDPDNAPNQLTYTVTSPPTRGAVLKGGSPITAFTQADINNGLVRYANNGSPVEVDAFTFTVSDGTNSTQTATFHMTIDAVPVVVVNTGLTAPRGGTALITRNQLEATDADNSAAQLTYTVTAGPAHGSLRMGGSSVTSFTQDDLTAGHVSYANDGSANEADSFTFTVSDGTFASGPATFALAVDAVPAITTNAGLTVARGGSALVTTADLQTTDADTSPGQLTYTVTAAPAHGTLRDNGIAVITFTQADLNAGRVSYVNDGTANEADSFQVAVTDGLFAAGPATFAIQIDAVPTVVTDTGLTVNQGSLTVITAAILMAPDDDNSPGQLTYAITTGPSHGELLLNGNPTSTFTQADIDAGRVSFQQDGARVLTDSFNFTVSDGSVGSASGTMTVTVNTAPLVTLQPADVTAFAGATVTFAAAADASPAPTVQWQVSRDGGASFFDIPGAASTTLLFQPTAADAGSLYRAVFTNVAASVPSIAATLTVAPGLAITADPVSQTVDVGSTVAFIAAATGSPRPHVQWQVSHDGGSTFANIHGATHTRLRVKASGTVDGNLYRAVFTNRSGSAATTAATLAVRYHVTLATRPATLVVPSGAAVALTGQVSGLSFPTVQWEASVDGGTTYTLVPGATDPTLTFAAAAADSGRYFRAVFTQGHTVRRTAAVLLAVGSPPAVTSPPADATVLHGTTVAFDVSFAGSPVVSVQWQVSKDGGKTFTDVRGATKARLLLKSVKTTLSGYLYRAVVTSGFGRADSAAAVLTVL